MSVKSAKQMRFMRAVASGSSDSDMSPAKAKEFIKSTPESKRKAFAKSFKEKKK